MKLVLGLTLISATALAAPPKLPAHYAKLFEQGHAITYDAVFTHLKVAEEPKSGRTSERSVVRCKVSRVVTFASSIVSEVTCDQEHAPDEPAPEGVFLARADGLYRIGTIPAKESDLPSGDELGPLQIPAAPRVLRKLEPQPDGKGVTGVRRTSDGWCAYSELTGAYHGHNGSSQTCYGRGVISELHVVDASYKQREWRLRARQ